VKAGGICRRCGKEISRHIWPPIVRVQKVYKIIVAGYGAYDYSEHEISLCQACNKGMNDFLYGYKKEAGA
jgi:hypothetical protein